MGKTPVPFYDLGHAPHDYPPEHPKHVAKAQPGGHQAEPQQVGTEQSPHPEESE